MSALLKNRVRTDELFINQKNILKRKEAYENRLNAMIHFCTLKNECRSVAIGFYFNGKYLPLCGICDNCLRNKKENISDEEFNFISTEIKKMLNKESMTVQNIIDHLADVKEEKIWKVLKFLQDEEMITVSKEGILKTV